ncbi:calpastatin-like isoform X3 [Macrotis lagotis]|uniref:calpastatin-like isoform X3 n=1 Tax=Macrotis lagotis TaxID=92651 RepID=UPI003D6932C8
MHCPFPPLFFFSLSLPSSPLVTAAPSLRSAAVTMSQPGKGKKPAASPRPKRAAAARAAEAHVSEKNNGTPSKTGEKKRSETEEKIASHSSSHPSRISSDRTASSKASTSFPASTSTFSMNPTETKATPIKQTKGLHYHGKKRKSPQAKKTETEGKSQSTKAAEPHMKDTHEEKAKVDRKQKSPSKQLLATETTEPFAGKELSDQPTGKPTEGPQHKSPSKQLLATETTEPFAGKELSDQPTGKPAEGPQSSLDDALDDLIDTLGGPEENEPESPKYTGPPISESLSSTYIEELGKRESTIPPEYRKLLESHEGAATDSIDSEKPMGEDEAIDSLSSDFTCSSTAPGKSTDKEKGEVLKAQSVDVVKSAVPPNEKKRRIEEFSSKSDYSAALDDLCDTLGSPEIEPETEISPSKEVDEAKSREERLKKCGEHEDTVPTDYQLKPAMDKDGKPLLPKPEEKSKPMSESKLLDELSKDFESFESQGEKPKPTNKTKKSEAPTHAPVKEDVSKTSMCVVQGAPQKPAPKSGEVKDDAVEALAGSLAKREIDPEEKKPVVDKVKEKSKEEKREKVGEKEETIPPEYRSKEIKDEDRKLLDKKQSEKVTPMSDDDIIVALSEGFSSSAAPVTHAAISVTQKSKDEKQFTETAAMEQPTPAPTTGSEIPPQTSQKDEGSDEAYDELSKSLGERKPDPQENKPGKDKVKEKVKAEHREKLGERDETIPPEYRHLLDNDDQGNPEKPPPKEPKNSADGGDPIDILSEGFDNCSRTPSLEGPQKLVKKKCEKDVNSTKPAKNGGKSKTKEKSSRSKTDVEKTS